MLSCEFAREDARFTQAFVLETLEQHAASAAILRRRRDAGTLLEGKCRSIEVQWFIGYAASVRCLAPLFGYEAFLNLCCSSMNLLCVAICYSSFEQVDAERALLSFTCDLLDDAVALMAMNHGSAARI